MGLSGLQWQTVQLPFVGGLQQKGDKRTQNPPALDKAYDVEFDQIGGLQTRKPFSAMTNSIFGGGTLSSCKQIFAYGDELCVLTDTGLYSWNAQLSKWVSRGTHLGVKIDEQTVFGTNADQQQCDRAELSNTIVYAWSDGTTSYVAAVDKTTGSVLLSPTTPNTNGISGGTRPRLVAMASNILLFQVNGGGDLVGYSIDPTTPSTGVAATPTTVISSASGMNSY